MKLNNIILTGATSMIGVSLIDECIKHEVKVTALVRKNSKNINRIPKSNLITIVECDLDNLDNVSLNETFDVFYHFGWEYTYHDKRTDLNAQKSNITYSNNAVELAKKLKCKKFIGAGSQAEYGIKSEKISPNTPCNPVIAYGKVKNEVSLLTRKKCDEYNITHVWVRIFSVYGIYENKNTMIQQTINKLLQNKVPSFTPSEQQWDYLYSEDAGRAFYLIGEKTNKSTVYCLGYGKTKKLKDYIIKLRNTINPNLKLNIGAIPYSEKQIMYLCADITNLTEETGFLPKYSFEEGISKTVEWHKKYYLN